MTAVTASSRPSRRRRIARVALILSLVLNLFFIGGAVWIRTHAPAPRPSFAERFRAIGAALDLDPRQQAAFDRYTRTMHEGFRRMRATVRPLTGEAWSQLAKPDAREADLMAIVDKIGESRRTFQRELTRATLTFLATLTPEQRAKFVALARRRTGWHHHPGRRAPPR